MNTKDKLIKIFEAFKTEDLRENHLFWNSLIQDTYLIKENNLKKLLNISSEIGLITQKQINETFENL